MDLQDVGPSDRSELGSDIQPHSFAHAQTKDGPVFLTYSQMQQMINSDTPGVPDEETISYQVPTRSISSNVTTNISGLRIPNLSAERSLYVTQSQAPLQHMPSEDLTYSLSQVQSQMPNIDEVSGEDLSHCDSQINLYMDQFLSKLENRIKQYTEQELGIQVPHFNLEGMSVQNSHVVSGKMSPAPQDSIPCRPSNLKQQRFHTSGTCSAVEIKIDGQQYFLEENQQLNNTLKERENRINVLEEDNHKLLAEKKILESMVNDQKVKALEQALQIELWEVKKQKQVHIMVQQHQSALKEQGEKITELQKQLAHNQQEVQTYRQTLETVQLKYEAVQKDNKSLVCQLSKKVQRIHLLERQIKLEKEQADMILTATKKQHMTLLKEKTETKHEEPQQKCFDSKESAAMKNLLFKLKHEHQNLQRTTNNLLKIHQELECETAKSPKNIVNGEPRQIYHSNDNNSSTVSSFLRTTEKKPVQNYLGIISQRSSPGAYQQQNQSSAKGIPTTFHQPVQYNIVQFPPYSFNMQARHF